ncbi:MAG TPA: PilZ domain-containing protein [Anaerolineales bacterium]|nr:PilZ domain-containing protein [Anaerolineales bacterium]
MERRREKRFNVVDLELFHKDRQDHVGTVINISRGGLLVNATEEFKPEEQHSFSIPFVKTINGEVKFDFKATIVWCQPNPLAPSAYSVGMEFTENPDLQTMFIQQMVKIYGDN